MVSWKLTNVWIVENTSSNGWKLPLSSYLSGVLLSGMILPLQGWFFPCFPLTYHSLSAIFQTFQHTSVASRCARADATVRAAGADPQHIAPAARDTSTGQGPGTAPTCSGLSIKEWRWVFPRSFGGKSFVKKQKWKPPGGPSPNTSLLQAIDAESFLWDIGHLRCSTYGIFTYTRY